MGRPVLRMGPNGPELVDSDTGLPMQGGPKVQRPYPAAGMFQQPAPPAPPQSWQDIQAIAGQRAAGLPSMVEPASRPGPDLRLAEPFTPQGPSQDDALKEKAYNYVNSGMAQMAQNQQATADTLPSFGAMSFARRYQDAGENERRAMIALGIGRDINQSMSTALTTGAHIRTGAKPPQFGTGLGEAVAMNAQGERQDLMTNESIDPNSELSKSTRAASLTINPDLSKIDPKVYNSMSHSQLMELAPLMGKLQDRQLKEAQLGNLNAQRQILNQSRKESLELARLRAERMPNKAIDKITEVKNGISAVNRVRDSFQGETGPIEGRISRAFIDLGIADPGVAVTNANVVDLMAKYIRSISGVAVSEKEFQRLSAMGPNIAQNQEQFEALLDNFEQILRTEGENTLSSYEANRYDVGSTRESLGNKASGGGGTVTVRKGAVTRDVDEDTAKEMETMGWTR